MATYQVRHYGSAAELRAAAPAWDDLWHRSNNSIPSARASLIALWLETFAPQADFRAIAIEQDGQLVAALPLVGSRLRGVLRVGKLPTGVWGEAGDLLVDPTCDVPAVLDHMVAALRRLPWPLLWLDSVPIESGEWQQLREALSRNQLQHQWHERFRIGKINCNRSWGQYQTDWSGNFRRQMRKMVKRAEQLGGVELVTSRPTHAAEIDRCLAEGFAVEDRGWKGAEGTSVLKNPVAYEYLRQQAHEMARLGHLELTFLQHQGQSIAFEYGWLGKGTYYSPKVGYDEAFAQLSPGQLIRLKMCERFFADPEIHTWDFSGPLVEATEKWTTDSYPVTRMVISTGQLRGRVLMHAYQSWWPKVRQARDYLRSRRSSECESNAAASKSADRTTNTAADIRTAAPLAAPVDVSCDVTASVMQER
ncbi:MAG: GNAT family N-acetyltransferase [Planctomycetota bacterium]|nr:GNAT family N-acetyltransferase [Planctomycetota bacterium]